MFIFDHSEWIASICLHMLDCIMTLLIFHFAHEGYTAPLSPQRKLYQAPEVEIGLLAGASLFYITYGHFLA